MLMLRPLSLYATFSGRARRAEYWQFSLLYVILNVVVTAIDAAAMETGILPLLFGLAFFLPALAVTVRRLHDTNRSGWWILIVLIPLIGTIWYIVLCCFDSTPGENRFGPNPKGV